jgi:cleavage and polyadenylation specificity factor subunit 4
LTHRRYFRGFCRHGPRCRHKHVKRDPCLNYLLGFCPNGLDCEFGHPKFELPEEVTNQVTCHHCGEQGHKIQVCPMRMNKKRPFVTPGNGGMMGGGGMGGKGGGMGGGMMGGGGGGCGGCGGGGNYGGGDMGDGSNRGTKRPFRNLGTVTCFRCGQPGHYANACVNDRVFQDPRFCQEGDQIAQAPGAAEMTNMVSEVVPGAPGMPPPAPPPF